MTYKEEVTCDPPLYIENIEHEASDVCRPYWLQGTLH